MGSKRSAKGTAVAADPLRNAMLRVALALVVIYERVLLTTDADATFLEVHPDVYGRTTPALTLAEALLRRANLSHLDR